MKLDVTQALKSPGEEFPFDVEQAIAPVEITGDTVTFDPARVAGKCIAGKNGSVVLMGSVRTTAHSRCANCLSPASADVEESFEEEFILGGDPEDDEIFSYTGHAVDLEKLTMSCAVLALPMRFLCREGCDSYPTAGQGQSDVRLCQKELPGQRPFAALQQLLDEKKNSGAD